MYHLREFLPAQTLLLLDTSCSLRELLKVTLMDLMLRQVLRTTTSPAEDPDSTGTYVLPGREFYAYNPSPHEKAFLNPFLLDKDAKVLFRHLIQIGYENSGGRKHYKEMLTEGLVRRGYMEKDFWHYLFGGCRLTPAGEQKKKVLEQELRHLQQELPLLLKQDQAKVMEVLQAIKGNLALLPNFNSSLLKKIERELKKQNAGAVDNDWSGFGIWFAFDDYSNTFDSSCSHDADGGNGDAGCSGGGCSSCGSGCGGGCGGS